MKTINFLSMFAFLGLFLIGCSDDDGNPEPVNEEETITTMTVTLVPSGDGDTVTLTSRDLDGDGPDAPVIDVSGNLTANTTYGGAVVLLNETETPAENITEEVKKEDEDHQFFFVSTGSIAGVEYGDQDGDGNPVGLIFTLTTGDAGDASLAVTLRHEPKKPNDGTLADAGGETDIAQTFTITVE